LRLCKNYLHYQIVSFYKCQIAVTYQIYRNNDWCNKTPADSHEQRWTTANHQFYVSCDLFSTCKHMWNINCDCITDI